TSLLLLLWIFPVWSTDGLGITKRKWTLMTYLTSGSAQMRARWNCRRSTPSISQGFLHFLHFSRRCLSALVHDMKQQLDNMQEKIGDLSERIQPSSHLPVTGPPSAAVNASVSPQPNITT